MLIQTRQARSRRSSSGFYESSRLAARQTAPSEELLVHAIPACLPAESPLFVIYHLSLSSPSCVQALIRALVCGLVGCNTAAATTPP